MAGKYVVRKTRRGEFLFDLVGDNGDIILTSLPHPTKASALQAIATIRMNAPMEKYYARQTAAGGQLYFTLQSSLNESLARSELFTMPAALEQHIQAAIRTAPRAPSP